MHNQTIKVTVPAKINIGLRVFNRRPDGYHNLDTLFQSISMFDDLSIEEADVFSFSASGQWDVPLDETNLVVKAARKLCEYLGKPLLFRIHLNKIIPPGGGLGGGSADAAGILVGINQLFDSPCTDIELERFSASIGSDCPFFIRGGLQQASGRGECLRDVPRTVSGAFAIWYPGVGVSTSEAYRLLGRSLTPDEPTLILYDRFLSTGCWWKEESIVNDFEEVVAPRIPEWNRAIEFWLDHGARWISLSGSGSCQIAYFTDKSACEASCAVWQLPGQVWVTEPVSRGVQTNKICGDA